LTTSRSQKEAFLTVSVDQGIEITGGPVQQAKAEVQLEAINTVEGESDATDAAMSPNPLLTILIATCRASMSLLRGIVVDDDPVSDGTTGIT
jgi:hypothetical protein